MGVVVAPLQVQCATGTLAVLAPVLAESVKSLLRCMTDRDHCKYKFGISSKCKVMVKKQSFKLTIKMSQVAGIIAGDGIPGRKAPILSITVLIFLKSWNNFHLPNFFLITNSGVFRGFVDGSICP